MSKLPQTRHEMERAEYEFKSHSSCRSCKAPIEWWLTTNKRRMPFDPMPNPHSAAVTHFATCPNAAQHRGQGSELPSAAAKPSQARPQPSKEAQVDRLMVQLVQLTHARALVLLDDNGSIPMWRKGLSGDELRNDLISAGNLIRSEIQKGDTTL